jgi:hypothetical protein
LRQLLETEPGNIRAIQSWGSKRKQQEQPKRVAKACDGATDPLAALRQGRGWIDHVDGRELWELLIQVRWPDVLEVDDIAEFDKVYITAGLKGRAGGLKLEREPQKRGLKRRGRGT